MESSSLVTDSQLRTTSQALSQILSDKTEGSSLSAKQQVYIRKEFLKLQDMLEIEELWRYREMDQHELVTAAKKFNVADYPVEKLVFDPDTIIPNEDKKAMSK